MAGNINSGRQAMPIEQAMKEAQKKAKQKVLETLDVKGWAVINKILDGDDEKTQASLLGKMLQLIIPSESEVTTHDGDSISKLTDDELKGLVRDYLQSIRGAESQGTSTERQGGPILLGPGNPDVQGTTAGSTSSSSAVHTESKQRETTPTS